MRLAAGVSGHEDVEQRPRRMRVPRRRNLGSKASESRPVPSFRTDGFTSCRRATCSPDAGWPDRKAVHEAGRRPHTMPDERWRRSDACVQLRQSPERRKRAFNWTSRERFPWASTVGGDLGERLLAQRFPVFADTEEVTGSNPVAPTRHNVSIDPPLSAACQQIVSRSLCVTARTL